MSPVPLLNVPLPFVPLPFAVVGSFADFSSLNNPTGTSAGDLVFTSVADAVTVRAVPEPASLTMLGLRGRCAGRVCEEATQGRDRLTRSGSASPRPSAPRFSLREAKIAWGEREA